MAGKNIKIAKYFKNIFVVITQRSNPHCNFIMVFKHIKKKKTAEKITAGK